MIFFAVFAFSVNNSRVIIRISSAPGSGKGCTNTEHQQLYWNLEKAENCKNCKFNFKMVLHNVLSLKEALCSSICSSYQNYCSEWKSRCVQIQFVWNDYYLMDFHALNHTHSIITIYDLWPRSKRKSILRHHVYQIQLTFRIERKSFEKHPEKDA